MDDLNKDVQDLDDQYPDLDINLINNLQKSYIGKQILEHLKSLPKIILGFYKDYKYTKSIDYDFPELLNAHNQSEKDIAKIIASLIFVEIFPKSKSIQEEIDLHSKMEQNLNNLKDTLKDMGEKNQKYDEEQDTRKIALKNEISKKTKDLLQNEISTNEYENSYFKIQKELEEITNELNNLKIKDEYIAKQKSIKQQINETILISTKNASIVEVLKAENLQKKQELDELNNKLNTIKKDDGKQKLEGEIKTLKEEIDKSTSIFLKQDYIVKNCNKEILLEILNKTLKYNPFYVALNLCLVEFNFSKEDKGKYINLFLLSTPKLTLENFINYIYALKDIEALKNINILDVNYSINNLSTYYSDNLRYILEILSRSILLLHTSEYISEFELKDNLINTKSLQNLFSIIGVNGEDEKRLQNTIDENTSKEKAIICIEASSLMKYHKNTMTHILEYVPKKDLQFFKKSMHIDLQEELDNIDYNIQNANNKLKILSENPLFRRINQKNKVKTISNILNIAHLKPQHITFFLQEDIINLLNICRLLNYDLGFENNIQFSENLFQYLNILNILQNNIKNNDKIAALILSLEDNFQKDFEIIINKPEIRTNNDAVTFALLLYHSFDIFNLLLDKKQSKYITDMLITNLYFCDIIHPRITNKFLYKFCDIDTDKIDELEIFLKKFNEQNTQNLKKLNLFCTYNQNNENLLKALEDNIYHIDFDDQKEQRDHILNSIFEILIFPHYSKESLILSLEKNIDKIQSGRYFSNLSKQQLLKNIEGQKFQKK